MDMKDKIRAVLKKTPGLTGREIGKKIGEPKSKVNSFLYGSDEFLVDNYCWINVESLNKHVLELEANCWVDETSFENSLKACGCLLSSNCKDILVVLPEKCSVLLVAGARLLNLLNQLILAGKDVTIDFNACASTRHYFNRAGFFDLLDKKVNVLPSRPKQSTAQIYKGNNISLVEFGLIDPSDPDTSIPKKLTESFVAYSGTDYYMSAFTIFSELFGNVEDHSNTPIPGFAGLQKYGKKSGHIQTVVSDSGEGIAETLKPALKEHYPNLYSKFDMYDVNTDIELITRAFTKGGLSQFGSDSDSGRGLGLNKSTNSAMKYNAKLLIRQETFSLELIFNNSELSQVISDINLPKILGTHICFDFYIAKFPISA